MDPARRVIITDDHTVNVALRLLNCVIEGGGGLVSIHAIDHITNEKHKGDPFWRDTAIHSRVTAVRLGFRETS